MRNTTHRHEWTWEDATLPLPDGWTADVDLELRCSVCPAEPQTWDYPGSPATLDVEDAQVKRVTFYGADGEQVDGAAIGVDHSLVRALWWTHYEANREQISGDLLERVSEDEQYAREAAMEDAAEARRDAARHWHDQRHEARVANTLAWERGDQ